MLVIFKISLILRCTFIRLKWSDNKMIYMFYKIIYSFLESFFETANSLNNDDGMKMNPLMFITHTQIYIKHSLFAYYCHSLTLSQQKKIK